MMKQKQIKCPYCHANASLRPASVVYGLNRRSQGKFLYLCDRSEEALEEEYLALVMPMTSP